MYEPVIKWSGSKRSQAEQILKYFPREIDTYYEPFCDDIAEKGYCACYAIWGWIWMLLIAIAI